MAVFGRYSTQCNCQPKFRVNGLGLRRAHWSKLLLSEKPQQEDPGQIDRKLTELGLTGETFHS